MSKNNILLHYNRSILHYNQKCERIPVFLQLSSVWADIWIFTKPVGEKYILQFKFAFLKIVSEIKYLLISIRAIFAFLCEFSDCIFGPFLWPEFLSSNFKNKCIGTKVRCVCICTYTHFLCSCNIWTVTVYFSLWEI